MTQYDKLLAEARELSIDCREGDDPQWLEDRIAERRAGLEARRLKNERAAVGESAMDKVHRALTPSEQHEAAQDDPRYGRGH
jgi:hypothetical protein